MSVPANPVATPPPAGGKPPADLRRKAHARLAEKIDPARTRHKPLSLVRADARRLADQFLDAEAPALTRPERDRLAEDVLAALPGAGPLEELFRDEAVAEVLVLAPAQVIAYKAGAWVPTSARYRDADQVRAVLQRYAELGEPLQPAAPAAGAVDVRLPTGFRVIGVVPPEVMGVPPVLHLTRGPAVAAAAAVPPPGRSGVTPVSAVQRSGVIARTARPGPVGESSAGGSGIVSVAAVLPPAAGGSMSSTSGRLPPPKSGPLDPFAKLKQRMTEKIIMRLASAGVYDLNQVPLPELRKFVTLAVAEHCQQEKMDPDPDFQQRLGLEILAGMNR
jgi:hypothetical protein